MEPGQAWRTQCWTRARADLLPALPLEVVRNRVRRAQELCLPYRSYATIRATTGRDIVAFLFSSNALDMRRTAQPVPPARAARLSAIRGAERLVAAHAPISPEAALTALRDQGLDVSHALAAPGLAQGWSETRARLTDAVQSRNLHPASVLVIGATTLERGWPETARLAGYLPAETYFA